MWGVLQTLCMAQNRIQLISWLMATPQCSSAPCTNLYTLQSQRQVALVLLMLALSLTRDDVIIETPARIQEKKK